MNYVYVSLWSLAKGIFTVHGNEGSWNAIYFEGPPELIEYIIQTQENGKHNTSKILNIEW